MLYFVQAGADGLIKIGTAISPARRIRQLQTGSAIRLDTLLICRGNEEEERELHQRFAQYRAHGEWFYPNDELLSLIWDRQQPVSGIPSAVATLIRGITVYQWVIKDCPLCHGKHYHGGGPLDGDPLEYLGHRVAHCIEDSSGYILTH